MSNNNNIVRLSGNKNKTFNTKYNLYFITILLNNHTQTKTINNDRHTIRNHIRTNSICNFIVVGEAYRENNFTKSKIRYKQKLITILKH